MDDEAGHEPKQSQQFSQNQQSSLKDAPQSSFKRRATTRVADLHDEWTRLVSGTGSERLSSRHMKVYGYEPTIVTMIDFYERYLSQQIEAMGDITTGAVATHLDSVNEVAETLARYVQLIETVEGMEIRSIGKSSKQQDLIDHRGLYRHVECSLKAVWLEERAGFLSGLFGDRVTFQMSNWWRGVAGDSLHNFFYRAAIAVVAGASILLPMIIMTFVRERAERLVIVSIAVLLFAVGMSAASQSSESVIGATAGYAAVLVVYIGSSGAV